MNKPINYYTICSTRQSKESIITYYCYYFVILIDIYGIYAVITFMYGEKINQSILTYLGTSHIRKHVVE